MNKELKKQFENIIDEYLKVQEEKTKAAKAEESANEELKKLWKDWQKDGLKAAAENYSSYKEKREKIKINKIIKSENSVKYYTVLEQVYEKILSIAAKNVILDAMKEESQKAKSKLLKPIRFKVVQDFLKNILESDKIHCYVSSNEYRVEIEFYVVKTQYNNTWINVTLYDLMENSPSWEERYFDLENIEKANFNSLNYNPEEIAKNYIKFMDTAKKELEKFKKKWDEMRNKGTLNGKFVYMGDGKNSIEERFYF